MKNGLLFATISTIMYFCSAKTEMRWLVMPHAKLKKIFRGIDSAGILLRREQYGCL